MEATLEHLIFLAAHDTYMGTLLDLGYDVILEGGVDMAFRVERQKMANFLETLESTGETDGTYTSQFEAAMGSEFMCAHVCHGVAFAMSEELSLTAVEDTSDTSAK